MKIGYLCPDPGIPLDGTKGASAHVRSFLRALQSMGHEVWAASPSPGDPAAWTIPVVPVSPPLMSESLESYLSKGEAKRTFRALRHIWNNVGVESALVRAVAERGADLIYERYSPFGIAGAMLAERMGIPHVLEVNAPLAWEGARYRGQALGEASVALERAAFDATGLIVTVSEELAALLVDSGVPAGKIEVVPNGVDVEMFGVQGPAARGPSGERVVIGFVGGLRPWHGIELLAEAFRSLAGDPRYQLLVVGDGPQSGVLLQLQEEFGDRVVWTGAVPHGRVPSLLREMDVAVAPYAELDTFYFSPLKVLEYMAAGRPVVASRMGQVQRLVAHGETGLLVPAGDALALARAIDELGRDRKARARMGRLASERARLTHTWESRIGQILRRAEEAGLLSAAKTGAAPGASGVTG